jgi:hypothetical protein
MNKNCICETAAARYRCRDYDPGTGGCDRMATEVKGPLELMKEKDTANDMANMWIESMKQDGLNYSQMLQVFALARQKFEALKAEKDANGCQHEKTYYCYVTGGARCRKCKKCL